MLNGRTRLFGFAASISLGASGLAATPAAAQATEPTYCYWNGNYYTCCNRYDVCTQIWVGDAPLPPEDPAESPED